MEIPDIPDNRPHKSPSVLSYSPTIVLDGATEYEFEPRSKEGYQDIRKVQHSSVRGGTPPDVLSERNQDLGTPEPQEKPRDFPEEKDAVRVPGDDERWAKTCSGKRTRNAGTRR